MAVFPTICKALHISGKSYISQAYANKAMSLRYSAMYLRLPRLMQHLQTIRGEEECLKYLAKLGRINLLILDDFGVSPLILNYDIILNACLGLKKVEDWE